MNHRIASASRLDLTWPPYDKSGFQTSVVTGPLAPIKSRTLFTGENDHRVLCLSLGLQIRQEGFHLLVQLSDFGKIPG